MCGGSFGKFQNFRHNAQMGFGIIPENSLTGKRVKFEADLENEVSGNYDHGTDKMLKDRAAKAAAEAQAKEAAAIEGAKKSSADLEETQKKYDAEVEAQKSTATEEEKMKLRRSLLAREQIVNDKPASKTTTNKTTLLGG